MSDADEIQTLHALNDSQAAEIARLTAELAALHSGDNLRAILDDDTTAMMREIEHDKAQIVSLTAEVKRLRADATRYRWLRDNVQPWRNGNAAPHAIVNISLGIRDGEERVFSLIDKTSHVGIASLDQAIDAARSKP